MRIFRVVATSLVVICFFSCPGSSHQLSDADLSYIVNETIFAEKSLQTCIRIKDRTAGFDYNAIAQYVIEGCFADYYSAENEELRIVSIESYKSNMRMQCRVVDKTRSGTE